MPVISVAVTQALQNSLQLFFSKRAKSNEARTSTTAIAKSRTDSGYAENDTHNDSELASLTRSEPTLIAEPWHWSVRKGLQEEIRAAPHLFLENGSRIKSERNQFGELIPYVPAIIRPISSIRQITNAPSTARWNPITASYIYSDENSSRGSWGQFKDKRRLIRQVEDDDLAGPALFADVRYLEAGNEVAGPPMFVNPHCWKADTALFEREEEMRFDRQRWRLDNKYDQSPMAAVEKESEDIETEPLTLKELAKLAAENENVMESYYSFEENPHIKKFRRF